MKSIHLFKSNTLYKQKNSKIESCYAEVFLDRMGMRQAYLSLATCVKLSTHPGNRASVDVSVDSLASIALGQRVTMWLVGGIDGDATQGKVTNI